MSNDKQPEEQTTAVEVVEQQPAKTRTALVVHDDSEVSHLMDSARFEQAQRVAKTLALNAFLPAHLKGATIEQSMANCFRVVNQALRWGMDPFAVADETYVVSGKLGYQGKLVASVVNTRANLDGRLSVKYEGSGDGLTATVFGKFRNETEVRTITLSVSQAKTSNKLWTSDPEQKLYYSAVVKWARRHCPEVVLGVLTDDDVRIIAEQPGTVTIERPTRMSIPMMAQAKAELESGNATLDDILSKFPNMPEDQVNELRGMPKSITLNTSAA